MRPSDWIGLELTYKLQFNDCTTLRSLLCVHLASEREDSIRFEHSSSSSTSSAAAVAAHFTRSL